MEFNLSGIHHAEPAFSGLVESPESQVHGVAFKMSLESAENLTRHRIYKGSELLATNFFLMSTLIEIGVARYKFLKTTKLYL